MTEEQRAVQHDVSVWDYRAKVQKFMVLVEMVNRRLGAPSDANALAVAVADHLGLWEDEDLPWWVMDAAEYAVGYVEKQGERDGR